MALLFRPAYPWHSPAISKSPPDRPNGQRRPRFGTTRRRWSFLVTQAGLAQTIDFVMRKRIVSATQAMELGLVNEVVPHENLEYRARELARELAHGPQVSMRLMKRSIYAATELSFEQACEDIASKTAVSDHHPDTRE